MRDGSPMHGHTGLEIFWTAIPVMIVTVFGVWAGIVLHAQRVGREGRHDDARRCSRRARSTRGSSRTRPTAASSRRTLYLPVDEGAKIETTATDVIHGFFVAEWRRQGRRRPGQHQPHLRHPGPHSARSACSAPRCAARATPAWARQRRQGRVGRGLREVGRRAEEAGQPPRRPARRVFNGHVRLRRLPHARQGRDAQGQRRPGARQPRARRAKGRQRQSTRRLRPREHRRSEQVHRARAIPANVMPARRRRRLSARRISTPSCT